MVRGLHVVIEGLLRSRPAHETEGARLLAQEAAAVGWRRDASDI
jgi:hypothetical protein